MRNYGKAAAFHGVYMVNCHATAGVDAMRALKEGIQEGAETYGTTPPHVVAVTVLTSLDNQRYIKTFQPHFKGFDAISEKQYNGIHEGEDEHDAFQRSIEEFDLGHIVQEQVAHLAELTHEAGLDGIVCSAADLDAVKGSLPADFMYVTPGIKGKSVGADQARVFTAANAIKAGSSTLVVGRAITDPRTPDEKTQGLDVTTEMQQQAAYDMIQSMVPELKYT